MPGEEHRSKHLSSSKEMMEVCPTMPGASWAAASALERGPIVGESCVPEVMHAGAGIASSGPTGPGWDYAIEHIDTSLDSF